MGMKREELIEMIMQELRTMDVMTLKLVWAFARGMKKRKKAME